MFDVETMLHGRASRLLAALILLVGAVMRLSAAESLEQTIDFLLHHIETADATFIRNGQSHTPREAVAHVRAKYEHFKGQIKTADDFIRLAASKSLLTGQPYLIRFPDGKEVQLNVWLSQVLKEHERNQGQ